MGKSSTWWECNFEALHISCTLFILSKWWCVTDILVMVNSMFNCKLYPCVIFQFVLLLVSSPMIVFFVYGSCTEGKVDANKNCVISTITIKQRTNDITQFMYVHCFFWEWYSSYYCKTSMLTWLLFVNHTLIPFLCQNLVNFPTHPTWSIACLNCILIQKLHC